MPSSAPHHYNSISSHKRGAHLQHRPPLRRKRSLRNGRSRLLPYNSSSFAYSDNGLINDIGRENFNNHNQAGRFPSALGSVADESLTSCTGPISHSESDFSSFNYNSASMGAAAKGGQKDDSKLLLNVFLYFLNYDNQLGIIF